MLNKDELNTLRDLSRRHHELLRRCVSRIIPGMSGLDCAAILTGMLDGMNDGSSLIRLDINRNDTVCHAPPDEIPFSEGDIITLDLVLEREGLFADGAWSLICGEDRQGRRQLLDTAWSCARQALLSCTQGESSLPMKKDLHELLRGSAMFLLPEACGHGIGAQIHLPPDIRYLLGDRDDIQWKKGLVFTAEPVITAGETSLIRNSSKDWITANGKCSAYFEHMCFMGEEKAECLNIPEIKDMNCIDIFHQII